MWTMLGGLGAFIVVLVGAFIGGKQAARNDSLAAENKLRRKYEEIDNMPDTDDPLADL